MLLCHYDIMMTSLLHYYYLYYYFCTIITYNYIDYYW